MYNMLIAARYEITIFFYSGLGNKEFCFSDAIASLGKQRSQIVAPHELQRHLISYLLV